jgi:hypothetical protein
MATKWLKRNIFDVLAINTVESATASNLVTLLDTQYRMMPEIAAIPNDFFYGGMLKNGDNTKNNNINDGISAAPLILIKTDAINPWCERMKSGGRFNIYNAMVCANIAKKALAQEGVKSVGIATPYAAQAKFINKIVSDWGLNNVHASTVHRFQGGQEQVIIFDTVEGFGVRIAPMIDSTYSDSNADLLLNVAITRAKSKFYLVGYVGYLLNGLNSKSSLTRLIKYLEQKGEVIHSGDIVTSYLVDDFEKYINTPNNPVKTGAGDLYNDKNFWWQFNNDIEQAKKRLIILSPFLSIRRCDYYVALFANLITRGVAIDIYTKPVNEQTGAMANQAEQMIEKMKTIGAKIVTRKGMHQKIAIIDDGIAWEGSLNILSHRDTGEQMRRFEGRATVDELIKSLKLNGKSSDEKSERCPQCGRLMKEKNGKYGKMWACTGYPACRYIE